jgi:hypothetical protein
MDRPLKFRDLERILRHFGAWIDVGRGKGSHCLALRIVAGERCSYPIPRHGNEVNSRYVTGCRKRLKLRPDDGVSDEDFYSA